MLCCLEYVEYPDGTVTPTANANANPNPNPNLIANANVNANPAPPATAHSPVQRAPGRIADYDPLSEARPSPYSARQAATTVIYTSDKGAGEFRSAFHFSHQCSQCPSVPLIIFRISF